MPFDAKKAQDTLRFAGAYADHPMGGFTTDMAAQLSGAMDEITALRTAAQVANRSNAQLLTDLEAAQASVARLRQGSSGITTAIDALKAIALNPRGASKVAATAIAQIEGSAK